MMSNNPQIHDRVEAKLCVRFDRIMRDYAPAVFQEMNSPNRGSLAALEQSLVDLMGLALDRAHIVGRFRAQQRTSAERSFIFAVNGIDQEMNEIVGDLRELAERIISVSIESSSCRIKPLRQELIERLQEYELLSPSSDTFLQKK